MKSKIILIAAYLVALTTSLGAIAQKGATPGTQGTGPTGGGSGASLQGLSWPHSSWDDDLRLPKSADRAVACYTLAYGYSAAQPFVLKPAKTDAERNAFKIFDCKKADGVSTTDDPIGSRNCKVAGETKWSPCSDLNSDHPILMGQTLVIGIDATHVQTDRIKVLNLVVTNQQGNPIDVTPIRPSFSNSGSGQTNLGGGIYFAAWNNQIPADSIETVNVNFVYTPVAPGSRWTPDTLYPAGSVVTSSHNDGHYYVASTGGVSDPTNEPAFVHASPAIVQDGTATWLDSGTTAPQGGGPGSANTSATPWSPRRPVNRGQTILDAYNGHYYTNVGTGTDACDSGTDKTCVTTGQAANDPFSLPSIVDNTVVWVDRGLNAPAGFHSKIWSASSTYSVDDWIGPENGHYFQVVQAGKSGIGPFSFPVVKPPVTVSDGDVVWQLVNSAPTGSSTWKAYLQYAIGTTVTSYNGYLYTATIGGRSGPPPAQPYFRATDSAASTPDRTFMWIDAGTNAPQSVASGQPSDQIISALNLQLAQSHQLSYFNLASGVVFSSVRSKTFGFDKNGPTETGNTPTIDPILLLTVYPKPIDAETLCVLNCLWTEWPGASIGFSLSNPTSSFYLGGNFELIRNLQLVAGYNWAKESRLAPSSTTNGMTQMNSGIPITVQHFVGGGYIGFTFNISGFIQSLFGSSGGASKGSSATSASGSTPTAGS